MAKRIHPAWLITSYVGGVILLGLIVLGAQREKYYTDGSGIRQDVSTAETRLILWEPAETLEGIEAIEDELFDPAFGADGSTLIMNKGRPQKQGGADLHISKNPSGEEWLPPTPLETLNSNANDIGAHLSADGLHLFFSSDREGGLGGYDIWYSWKTEEGDWSAPINAGPEVNTAFNEYDPAYDPYSDTLYFASNRPKRELTEDEKNAWLATQRELLFNSDYDVFRAYRNPLLTDEDGPQSLFEKGHRIPELNTEFDEGQMTLTPRGDFLYFASNREGGHGGFDLYRTRILDGQFVEIQNIGGPINTASDEMDPALTNHGYILVFSSNRPVEMPADEDVVSVILDTEEEITEETPVEKKTPTISTRFALYQSTSREVFVQLGDSALAGLWNFLLKNKWWVLLALVALALILYLLRLLSKRDVDLSTTARALIGSVLAHAVLAFLLSLWFITYQIIEEASDPLMEAALDTDALAKEQLALEIRETVTEMVPAVEEPIPVQAVRPDMPIPTVEPLETPDIAPPPDAFVVEHKPVQFQPPIPENTPTPQPTPELPPVELPPVENLQPRATTPLPLRMEDTRQLEAPTPEPTLQTPQMVQELTQTQTFVIPQTAPDTPTLEAQTEATLTNTPVVDTALPPLSAPELPTQMELPTEEAPNLPQLTQADSVPSQLDATRNVEAEQQPQLQDAQANQTLTQASPTNSQNTPAPTPAPAMEIPEFAQNLPTPNQTSLNAPTPELSQPQLTPQELPTQPSPELPQTLQPVAQEITLEATRNLQAEQQPELQDAQANQTLTKATPDAPDSTLAPAPAPTLDVPLVEEGILAKQHSQITPETPDLPEPSSSQTPLPNQPAPELPQDLQPVAVKVDLESTRDVQAEQNPELREAQPASAPSTQVAANNNPSQPTPEDTQLDTPELQAAAQPTQSTSTLTANTPDQSTPDQPAAELPNQPAPEIPDLLRPLALNMDLESTRDVEAQEQAQLKEVQPASTPSNRVASNTNPSQPAAEVAQLDTPDTETTTIAQSTLTLKPPTPDAPSPSPTPADLPNQPTPEIPVLSELSPLKLELESSRTLLAESQPALEAANSEQSSTQQTSNPTPNLPKAELAKLDLPTLPDLAPLDTPSTLLKTNLPPVLTPNLPDLAGPDSSIAVHLPTISHDPKLLLETKPSEEEPYLLRDPKVREKVLERLGGNEETEKAVSKALDWFSRNQEQDGRWSISRHGGQKGHDNAATAFAVLCYFGWGIKHNEPGKYKQTVDKALDWMIRNQEEDGGFMNKQHNGMYDHGVATMALAEAYGLTQDEKLKEPLQKAIQFIIDAQNQKHGAWDYRPRSSRIDSSVSGWQIMALRSARMAGLEVPDRPFELAAKWLNTVGAGRNRGIYGYDKRNYKTDAMVATGLFSQQLLGVSPDHPRMKESVKHLAQKMPQERRPDFYYWYYGSLSLYQNQGPVWEEWNSRMKPIWLNLQETTGLHAGSWSPRGGNHMGDMGRVITTALATLSLEVYYRYLPLYQTRAVTVTMQE